MSALVKVQRVDRNGKLVTRWVRDGVQDLSTSPSTIPPVALPETKLSTPSHHLQAQLIDDALSKLVGDRPYEDDNFAQLLTQNYSPELIGSLYTFVVDTERDKDKWVSLPLHKQVTEAIADVEVGPSLLPRLINHFDHLPEGFTHADATYLLGGMFFYDRDLTVEQERDILEVTGVAFKISATTYNSLNKFSVATISDNLVDLVLRRSENVPEIKSIMEERCLSYASQIESILDGTSHVALVDGAL